jgi:hypothetical protein
MDEQELRKKLVEKIKMFNRIAKERDGYAKGYADGLADAFMQINEYFKANQVTAAPKLDELLTKDGDLVFRQAYHSETTVIRKAEIEALLEGEELNDATVWEVIAKWDRRYATPSDTQRPPA